MSLEGLDNCYRLDKKICFDGRNSGTKIVTLIAKLHIEAAVRNEKTFVKNVFCTPPFRLADITEDRFEKALRLMMMSSSPGILDGDEYNIQIELEEGTSVFLETQSFQRLFQMKAGARQQMEIRMKKGSAFEFLPHPSVPHQSSIFTSKSNIYLSEKCSLTWGEVLTSGRKLRGESFLFTKYHSHTQIFLKNKLVVKENLLMEPQLIDVNKIGQLEGYTHQASFIFVSEMIPPTAAIQNINELLGSEPEICFGVSVLSVNGLIVRILGYKGEQLHGLMKRLATLVRHFTSTPKTVAYAK